MEDDQRMDKRQTRHLAEWWASQLTASEGELLEAYDAPPYLTTDPELDTHIQALHQARLSLLRTKVRTAEYCHNRLEKK